MSQNEDENGTVSRKILVGEKKYREYRLDKSLQMDRSPLWRTKHEVGQRISEIMKSKTAKINELRRCMDVMEKTRAHWRVLAKAVNSSNEDFLLDVVLASTEELEQFEKDNFLSSDSWTKLKDVSELTAEELEELREINNDVEECEIHASSTRPNHYEWVRQVTHESDQREENEEGRCNMQNIVPVEKTDQFPASNNRFVGDKIRNVVKDTESLAADSQRESEQNVPHEPSVKSSTDNTVKIDQAVGQSSSCYKKIEKTEVSTEKHSRNVKNQQLNTEDHIDLTSTVGINPPVSTAADQTKQSTIKTKKTEDKEFLGASSSKIEVEKTNLERDSLEGNGIEPGETFSKTNKNREVPKTNDELPVDSKTRPKSDRTSTSSSEVAGRNELLKNHISETSCSTSSQPDMQEFPKLIDSPKETSKQQLTSLNGLPKLRFSGTETTTSLSPAAPVSPTPTNVWAQRIAQREEEEKKKKDVKMNITVTSSPGLVHGAKQLIKTNAEPFKPLFQRKQEAVKNERTTLQLHQNGQVANGVNGYIKKNHSKKEPIKQVDSDGWITLAPKKNGGHKKPANEVKLAEPNNNGNFSKTNLPVQSVTTAQNVEVINAIATTSSASRESSQSEAAASPAENAHPVAAEPDSPARVRNEDVVDAIPDQRSVVIDRQRSSENKVHRRPKKEKFKKERSSISHEELIEIEKRQKEEENNKLYLAKQKEFLEIREKREQEVQARRNKSSTVTHLQDLVECQKKVKQHIQNKDITYRWLGSKIFTESRMRDLSLENENISQVKYQRFEEHLKNKLVVENMCSFMQFVKITVNKPENRFTMEELVSFLEGSANDNNMDDLSEIEKAIRKEFKKYEETDKKKPPENLLEAINYVELLLDRLNTDEGEEFENAGRISEILSTFKLMCDNVMAFINKTSYLQTRMKTSFFICEEDYLLAFAGNQEKDVNFATPVSDDAFENDEEEIKVEKTDSSCQTDEKLDDVL